MKGLYSRAIAGNLSYDDNSYNLIEGQNKMLNGVENESSLFQTTHQIR